MDNIIDSIHKSNTLSEINSRRIDELKQQHSETLYMLDEIERKMEMLVMQNDFKEINDIKTKKLNEKLEKETKEKTFNWKNFWGAVREFCDNTKWLAISLICIIILGLIISKVTNWSELWKIVSEYFIKQ